MVDRRRRLGHQRQRVGRPTSTAASTTTSPTSSTARTRSRASDHNPEIVGHRRARRGRPTHRGRPDPRHERLPRSASSTTRDNDGRRGRAGRCGRSSCARENPNTVFAAAGDLIGASTFESFIQNDKPTIDALNEAGLEVSAAGNHEFDQGYDDLVNRVMAPYDATTNPYGGADWEYIAANVRKQARRLATPSPRPGSQDCRRRRGRLRRRGHRGPAGAGQPRRHRRTSTVTDIVDEINAAADDLKADGADVVVLLVHEGAPTHDVRRGAPTRARPSATSSTASTTTSTRSSRVTPTWPTTARSRCPAGPRAVR